MALAEGQLLTLQQARCGSAGDEPRRAPVARPKRVVPRPQLLSLLRRQWHRTRALPAIPEFRLSNVHPFPARTQGQSSWLLRYLADAKSPTARFSDARYDHDRANPGGQRRSGDTSTFVGWASFTCPPDSRQGSTAAQAQALNRRSGSIRTLFGPTAAQSG